MCGAAPLLCQRWCFPLSIVLPCSAFSTSLCLTNFSTALSTAISSYVQSAALSHPRTLSVPPGKLHPSHQQVICAQGLLHGVSCALQNIHGQYIILINKTQIHGLAGLIRMVYVNQVYKFEVVCVCVAMKVDEGMVV